ncbi:hypothetical protein ACVWXQ_008583 [Bradyrhizobium sp. S3.14.4]
MTHGRDVAGEAHRTLDLVHRIVEQDRADVALARARQLQVLRGGRGIERLGEELLIGIEQVGGDVARLLSGLAARRRRIDLPGGGRDIVDHVGQRRPGAAVDGGVVHLGIEPDLVVLHALEHVELPERPGAVQELGVHPADDAFERGAVARLRQAGAEDVAVDVELVVLDPGGMIDIERRLLQPRLQDRRDVQARDDHRLEIFEEVALVVVRQAKDRHAADMHRHLRRFQIEK